MNAIGLDRRSTPVRPWCRTGPSASTHLSIPEDLRLWYPASNLVHRVLEAVTALELGRQGLAPVGVADESFTTAMLLGVLAYSYGTGQFDSEEIEARVGSDECLSYLAARRSPRASVLRQFRRGHRAVLGHALEHLLFGCLATRLIGPGDSVPPAGPSSFLASSLAEAARQDAEARIERAVLEDAVAADL